MRDMIVRSLNVIIWIVFAAMIMGSLFGGAMLFSSNPFGGFIFAIGGCVFSVFSAGIFFLATGIYELLIGIFNNSERTANALEAVSTSSDEF